MIDISTNSEQKQQDTSLPANRSHRQFRRRSTFSEQCGARIFSWFGSVIPLMEDAGKALFYGFCSRLNVGVRLHIARVSPFLFLSSFPLRTRDALAE